MMIFTTASLALLVIAVLYFAVIRFVPWAPLAYAIVVAAGIACLADGSVHFRYVGLEIIGLGMSVVWLHFRFWRKPRQLA